MKAVLIWWSSSNWTFPWCVNFLFETRCCWQSYVGIRWDHWKGEGVMKEPIWPSWVIARPSWRTAVCHPAVCSWVMAPDHPECGMEIMQSNSIGQACWPAGVWVVGGEKVRRPPVHSKDLDRHINRRYISIIHMNGNEIHHCQPNFTLIRAFWNTTACAFLQQKSHEVTVARVDYKWTNWKSFSECWTVPMMWRKLMRSSL